MRALAHLWTGGPPPREYIELYLCREVFHCLPSELKREPLTNILPILTMLEVEGQVERLKNRKR